MHVLVVSQGFLALKRKKEGKKEKKFIIQFKESAFFFFFFLEDLANTLRVLDSHSHLK